MYLRPSKLRSMGTFNVGKWIPLRAYLVSAVMAFCHLADGRAQIAPSQSEIDSYRGLHLAAAQGDLVAAKQLVESGSDINVQDAHGRTPLMVATYSRNTGLAKFLIEHGADVNVLDVQRYDMLTIAAVLNDVDLVTLAIDSGADAGLVTSPYDGTALIAAAHLGHVEVVGALIKAGAPVDHVNNLGWTALIEAIVLGDGGRNHQLVVQELVDAGADLNLADKDGVKPLSLARQYAVTLIEQILLQAGAQP